MRTCFIHIGTHKTGTTSIQMALHEHRVQLRRRGVLYPRAGIPPGFLGHHYIAGDLWNGPESLGECEHVNALLDEMRGWSGNVILSSEVFGFAIHDSRKLKAFLARLRQEAFRIVLIVYFRDQASYARSVYIQLLTHGGAEPFDAFLSSVVHERKVRFKEMTFAFCYDDFVALLPLGEDVELVVRSYERHRSSAVADFLSIAGLGLKDLGLAEEPKLNREPALGDSFRLFYRNRRGRPIEPAEQWALAGIGRILQEQGAGLTGLTRQRILAAFDQSNQRMNARFEDCCLTTLATENPETWSDDRLHVESVFSEAAARLVEGLALGFQELDAARNAALRERDSFAIAYDRAIADRDVREGQRAEAAVRRDAWEQEHGRIAAAHAAASAERDRLARALEGALAERDRLAAEGAMAAAERGEMQRRLQSANAEQAALGAAHAALQAERDALLASRSWRITAPLRRIQARLRRPPAPR